MRRKGTATVKKVNREDRYKTIDSGSKEISPTASNASDIGNRSKGDSHDGEFDFEDEQENVDPAASGERLNLSKAAAESGPHADPDRRQPRQAPGTVDQSHLLENALFPADVNKVRPSIEGPLDFTFASRPQTSHQQPTRAPRGRARNSATPRTRATGQGRGTPAADANLAGRTPNTAPTGRRRPGQNSRPNPPPKNNDNDPEMADMIQGGAYIPPNQQRNMRACMVCSVVRTQQQFLTQGCPNCEDILELAGNPEQINDCTSQVFEGLITVADTTRSWVARYQRLEGYKPGVYATQVEGILPDEVIGAVESAGINYVPRDGSEQDMLPKD
jgi:transcription elongation factor SPT4